MNELTEAVQAETNRFDFHPDETCSPFRVAGILWAANALKTFDGDLLRKALAVSAAITDFCNELELKGPTR